MVASGLNCRVLSQIFMLFLLQLCFSLSALYHNSINFLAVDIDFSRFIEPEKLKENYNKNTEDKNGA
jgi:hypothetical protein